jgi:AraC-like DNA-binding protein
MNSKQQGQCAPAENMAEIQPKSDALSFRPTGFNLEDEIPFSLCPRFVDAKVWMRLQYYARFRKLLRYLDQNLADPVRLDDVAKISCMNPTSFSKLFKARVGITLRRFVGAYKIGKAHELMMSRDLSITEIARALGFATLSTFERTFRRITGCTPSHYRTRLLEKTGLLVRNQDGEPGRI